MSGSWGGRHGLFADAIEPCKPRRLRSYVQSAALSFRPPMTRDEARRLPIFERRQDLASEHAGFNVETRRFDPHLPRSALGHRTSFAARCRYGEAKRNTAVVARATSAPDFGWIAPLDKSSMLANCRREISARRQGTNEQKRPGRTRTDLPHRRSITRASTSVVKS
jgi:hypothetical protein